MLRQLESVFPAGAYPQVLIGLRPPDDAAVYRLSADRALVATLDFFTPIVDDPYTFGAIAAANALSDVYAMGAAPFMALNISCLSGAVPPEVVGAVLAGGAAKIAEAGAVVVGGHSVDDKEPKYGLVVLGFAHPDRLWTKAAARAGDVLVLSKPLGVGVITTALKRDVVEAAHLDAAVASMLRLHAPLVPILHDAAITCATDITGFALLGHASEVAERSNVALRLRGGDIPLLPGAIEYAERGVLPGGAKRNQAAYGPRVAIADGVPAALASVLFTPETSGGLLAGVRPERVSALRAACASVGQPLWVIGEVVDHTGGPLIEVSA